MSAASALEELLYQILVPGGRQIKTALLIARACKTEEISEGDVLDAALDLLWQRQDIEVFGSIHKWRHSEIRRKSSTMPI